MGFLISFHTRSDFSKFIECLSLSSFPEIFFYPLSKPQLFMNFCFLFFDCCEMTPNIPQTLECQCVQMMSTHSITGNFIGPSLFLITVRICCSIIFIKLLQCHLYFCPELHSFFSKILGRWWESRTRRFKDFPCKEEIMSEHKSVLVEVGKKKGLCFPHGPWAFLWSPEIPDET